MDSKLCLGYLWLMALTFVLVQCQPELPEAQEEVLSQVIDPEMDNQNDHEKIEEVLNSEAAEVRVQPSELCLDCMCAVQSGDGMTPGCGLNLWWEGDGKCGGSGCVENRQHCRCGPYLLTEEQFHDCTETRELPYKDFRTCAWNNDCARMCMREYIGKYAVTCTGKRPEKVTCSDMARMLFAGKDRCTLKKTRPFGRKVGLCVRANQG